MTAITVGDTYGEAKQAGASDLEATLLTLGYAAGEYAILSTGLGEWILPELREEGQLTKAVNKVMTSKIREATEGLGSKEARKAVVKNWFNKGKQMANDLYYGHASGAKQLAGQVFAHGLGEGTEEVSEELLADFSKGCFNVVNWLRGSDTRMDTAGFTWDDEGRSWSLKDIRDRYGLSFVGGLVGGSATSLGTSFTQPKQTIKTTEEALQYIIYTIHEEGNANRFRRALKKETLANKNFSTQIDEFGNFKVGTKEDNWDLATKKIFDQQLTMIENIMAANGATATNSQVLDA
jgi:hypothetical protein